MSGPGPGLGWGGCREVAEPVSFQITGIGETLATVRTAWANYNYKSHFTLKKKNLIHFRLENKH